MKLSQERTKSSVLSIAGLDPSGGAGVYTDIKVFESFGLDGLAVPTVLTIQNDVQFKGMTTVEPELFAEMLELMFQSYKVQGLKIGLINSRDHVETILSCIKKYNPSITILDPVICSSSGFKFWDEELKAYIAKELIQAVDVITPNYSEALALLRATGNGIGTIDAEGVARELNKTFRTKVAVTGGDSSTSGKITDVFFDGVNMFVRNADLFETPKGSKHGTGCSFSAALLSGMCNGKDFMCSCKDAAFFVENRIKKALYSASRGGINESSY